MNLQFGSGVLYGIPNAGNLAANPTPQKFGILQEFSLRIQRRPEEAFRPESVSGGQGARQDRRHGKGKDRDARSESAQPALLRSGGSTGVQRIVPDESHAPSTSSRRRMHAAVAGTVVTDYGVINKDTGLNMEKIASGTPAVGQYKFTPATTGGSPTAAAWVFNASETASAVLLTYLYPIRPA
jgi:hypothetical protein